MRSMILQDTDLKLKDKLDPCEFLPSLRDFGFKVVKTSEGEILLDNDSDSDTHCSFQDLQDKFTEFAGRFKRGSYIEWASDEYTHHRWVFTGLDLEEQEGQIVWPELKEEEPEYACENCGIKTDGWKEPNFCPECKKESEESIEASDQEHEEYERTQNLTKVEKLVAIFNQFPNGEIEDLFGKKIADEDEREKLLEILTDEYSPCMICGKYSLIDQRCC